MALIKPSMLPPLTLETMHAVLCDCFDCVKARVDATPVDPTASWFDRQLPFQRMFVCPHCGNKRCPRAKNHNNRCTDSNAPGQPGSLYEGCK